MTSLRATARSRPVALIAVTARLIHPVPLLLAPIIAGVIVWRAHLTGDVADLLLAAGVAIGVSPSLDDPAASTLAPSPTAPAHRVATRLAVALPVAVVLWAITRGVCRTLVNDGLTDRLQIWIPSREAWLVLATLVVVALAVEAWSRADGPGAGIAGAGAIVFLLLVTFRLPDQWSMLPITEHASRWLALVAVAGLLFGRAIRDPGRARARTQSGDLRSALGTAAGSSRTGGAGTG